MGGLNVKIVRESLNDWGIDAKLANSAKRAEHAMAVQAAKDTDPYVPMRTGRLKNSARPENVKDNLIIYTGPYARYLYYGKVMVNAATGKGPMHFTDKKGNEVIMFRKGTKLRASNRDLNIRPSTTSPYAQAFWFEASKRQNLEKWKRFAARAVTHYDSK